MKVIDYGLWLSCSLDLVEKKDAVGAISICVGDFGDAWLSVSDKVVSICSTLMTECQFRFRCYYATKKQVWSFVAQ